VDDDGEPRLADIRNRFGDRVELADELVEIVIALIRSSRLLLPSTPYLLAGPIG